MSALNVGARLNAQTDLARRLFETHRTSGSKFWSEISREEKDAWIRVARHIEARTSTYVGEAIAKPSS